MAGAIEISTATPADQQEWDSFVLARSDASPYHLFGWGAAITQAYGHKLFYLMAREDGILVGILPLVHLKLSLFLNELVALPFCDVGNCLSVNSMAEEKLLDGAMKFGKKLKIKNMQLRGQLHGNNNSEAQFVQVRGNKVRMLLELPDSSEVLFDSFKSKLRSQVRRAEKNGVTFRWAGKDGVESFYSVFSVNMNELGSPVHSKKMFQSVMEKYGDNARIGLTEFEKKPIGAGLILSTDEQTAIPWASTLRRYNRLAPNMLLYWNCIKFAADTGKKIFDFGRSTAGEGTFRFKQQWGAQPVPLLWYSFSHGNPKPFKERQPSPIRRKMVASIWKRIPEPVANFVGPQLRGYINL